MRLGKIAGLLLAAGLLALSVTTAVLAARGRVAGAKTPATEHLGCVSTGGTLTAYQENDFENLDPGIAYYSTDYTVVYATQRPLYSYMPNSTQEVPDLAEGPPALSDNGRTVTVRLKSGVHFSPPVNREVTADDVAYAIERAANPDVGNPYFQSYFASIEGAEAAQGGQIRGIQTPTPHEIVFHLTRPLGLFVSRALALPVTAPVPREYATPLDRRHPSAYGSHQVATGPYMLKSDAAGTVEGIGYVPGRSATLVRNPNWNPATDFRPACLDEVKVAIGGFGGELARLTMRASAAVDVEEISSPGILASAQRAGDLELSPGAGMHYIGLNNKVGPFRNEELRKALWAALDKESLDAFAGGHRLTTSATHFIYPTIDGFRAAGGYTGPRGRAYAFDHHPRGDLRLARTYMRRAGYPSGRYTGTRPVSIVAGEGPPARERAELINRTLHELGFRTHLLLVPTYVMYGKYCNVPRREITVCPSVGWLADFSDPQTVLNITFNGHFISETGNVNWSQVDMPWLNRRMREAEAINNPVRRERAWAAVDDALVRRAVAIPLEWDTQPHIEGSVNGVGDLWNLGSWDYSFTSLR